MQNQQKILKLQERIRSLDLIKRSNHPNSSINVNNKMNSHVQGSSMQKESSPIQAHRQLQQQSCNEFMMDGSLETRYLLVEEEALRQMEVEHRIMDEQEKEVYRLQEESRQLKRKINSGGDEGNNCFQKNVQEQMIVLTQEIKEMKKEMSGILQNKVNTLKNQTMAVIARNHEVEANQTIARTQAMVEDIKEMIINEGGYEGVLETITAQIYGLKDNVKGDNSNGFAQLLRKIQTQLEHEIYQETKESKEDNCMLQKKLQDVCYQMEMYLMK